VYGWFTEGFDTLDLKKAKAIAGLIPACADRARAARLQDSASSNAFASS
jgi:hypothetical protein